MKCPIGFNHWIISLFPSNSFLGRNPKSFDNMAIVSSDPLIIFMIPEMIPTVPEA
jgi:hypothetical protein